jgi:hypothetical protein
MKRGIPAILLLFVITPMAWAQEITPSRDLGDVVFTLDVETPTGDIRLIGVEFDDTNFWLTGAGDFTKAYLYEVSMDGVLINKYPQPPGNWGYWGWRDLAWDGQYLYAGDDSNMPYYITQIDPNDGQPTGVYYGPFPLVPCRALGYDSSSDSFWTASWSSEIYQCFRDNTYQVYPNPGIGAISGCAFEESNPNHPMGWFTSQDGGGSVAHEFDPQSGSFTGKSFDLLGGSGGACAFDYGGGQWVLVVLSLGSPDQLIGYDLGTLGQSLKIYNPVIQAEVGGTATFSLSAGTENAYRDYALLGSLSGHSPGTPLPGGSVILPLNMDFITSLLLGLNPPGFMGALEADGTAVAALTVPKFHLYEDLTVTFAYALEGPPWDFASNFVELQILAIEPPPEEYAYDDGSSESIFGWAVGGEMCWMHVFETIPSNNVIETIRVVWGSPAWPGLSPGNGTPSTVYIWNDPNDDGDPSDGVLLDSASTTVQNVDTDLFNDIPIGPVTVNGLFIVGCNLAHQAGQYVAPMDEGGKLFYYGGNAWVAGNPGGTFDPNDIGGGNHLYEMGSLGYPCYFLLRAK